MDTVTQAVNNPIWNTLLLFEHLTGAISLFVASGLLYIEWVIGVSYIKRIVWLTLINIYFTGTAISFSHIIAKYHFISLGGVKRIQPDIEYKWRFYRASRELLLRYNLWMGKLYEELIRNNMFTLEEGPNSLFEDKFQIGFVKVPTTYTQPTDENNKNLVIILGREFYDNYRVYTDNVEDLIISEDKHSGTSRIMYMQNRPNEPVYLHVRNNKIYKMDFHKNLVKSDQTTHISWTIAAVRLTFLHIIITINYDLSYEWKTVFIIVSCVITMAILIYRSSHDIFTEIYGVTTMIIDIVRYVGLWILEKFRSCVGFSRQCTVLPF